jgi:hypothetical protein
MRRIDLSQPALVDYRDAVRHCQCFALVVSYVDGGYAELLVQVFKLDLHLLAQFFIECGKRFVHQQDARAKHESASQCHPLSLAPGQLVDTAIAKIGQLYGCQRLGDAIGNFCGVDLAQFQWEGNIFCNRHVREQCVALKHHADVASMGWRENHLCFAESDTSRVRPVESGYRHQQRGFA